jgi:hypothetical protein
LRPSWLSDPKAVAAIDPQINATKNETTNLYTAPLLCHGDSQ